MKVLAQDFYFQDTAQVAKDLLGKILHVKLGGHELKSRIVETEAYLGIDDPACHSFGGRRTPRTETMYLDGGHSYVYLIYGMYNCLNFVTRTIRHPEAVLIRAVQPFEIDATAKKKDLKTNGPGKLCKYYGITRSENGVKLWKKNSVLFVSEDESQIKKSQVISCPRIGVDYAGEAARWPLRFYINDNFFVSKK